MLQRISYIVQGDGEVPQSQEIAGLSFGKTAPDGEGFSIETKSLFGIDVAREYFFTAKLYHKNETTDIQRAEQ